MLLARVAAFLAPDYDAISRLTNVTYESRAAIDAALQSLTDDQDTVVVCVMNSTIMPLVT